MKYLVMECHPAYAVVLDEKGRFLKVANFHYEVGETLTDVEPLRPARRKHYGWIMPLMTAACLVAILLAGVFLYQLPRGTVRLTVNPDVLLTVNKLDHVIQMEGLNAEGRALVEGYSCFGKDLTRVAEELTDRARAMGFLQDGDRILLDAISDDAQWNLGTEQELALKLQAHVGEMIVVQMRPEESQSPSASDPTETTDDDDPDDDDDDDDSDDDEDD